MQREDSTMELTFLTHEKSKKKKIKRHREKISELSKVELIN